VIGYQREAPAGDDAAIAATVRHVREHLAAVADADDDPATRAEDVSVWLTRHPDDPQRVIVRGQLDADPQAAYLTPGYEPLADLDPELLRAAGLEVPGGS